MKASVYMQGKRIKMFDIKARFGLWEERRGEARWDERWKTFPPRTFAKQKKKKRGGWTNKEWEEQEFERLNKEGVSRQHITVSLQSTIATAGVAAIESAQADVCVGRHHRGAQTHS